MKKTTQDILVLRIEEEKKARDNFRKQKDYWRKKFKKLEIVNIQLEQSKGSYEEEIEKLQDRYNEKRRQRGDTMVENQQFKKSLKIIGVLVLVLLAVTLFRLAIAYYLIFW